MPTFSGEISGGEVYTRGEHKKIVLRGNGVEVYLISQKCEKKGGPLWPANKDDPYETVYTVSLTKDGEYTSREFRDAAKAMSYFFYRASKNIGENVLTKQLKSVMM